MKTRPSLPSGRRAVPVQTLERIDAAVSKSIGLISMLSVVATSEHWLNSSELEGIRRLASDIGGELESAVGEVPGPESNLNQQSA